MTETCAPEHRLWEKRATGQESFCVLPFGVEVLVPPQSKETDS